MIVGPGSTKEEKTRRITVESAAVPVLRIAEGTAAASIGLAFSCGKSSLSISWCPSKRKKGEHHHIANEPTTKVLKYLVDGEKVIQRVTLRALLQALVTYHTVLLYLSAMCYQDRIQSRSSSEEPRHATSFQKKVATGERWLVALTVVAALASREKPVEAFQSPSFPLTPRLCQVLSFDHSKFTHLKAVRMLASADEPQTLPRLFGHDRQGTSSSDPCRAIPGMISMSSSNMFLKSNRISLHPVSSLSSDFYDSKTTTIQRSSDLAEPKHSSSQSTAAIPTQRTRGILGFAFQNHGGHIVSTSRTPPPVGSSTSLQSSQSPSQEQQQLQQRFSPRSNVDFATWGGKQLGTDWVTSGFRSSSSNGNPILNRSPSNRFEGTDDEMDIPAWFPWVPTLSQIQELKVKELKRICAERGLKQVSWHFLPLQCL